MRKTRLDRFWEKVVVRKQDDCWLWTAALYGKGYGHFWNGQSSIPAHVYSWQVHNDEIPEGMLVCHECDVRRCVYEGLPKNLELPLTVCGKL